MVGQGAGFSSAGSLFPVHLSTGFNRPSKGVSDKEEQGDRLAGEGGDAERCSSLPGLTWEPSELDFSLLQSSMSSAPTFPSASHFSAHFSSSSSGCLVSSLSFALFSFRFLRFSRLFSRLCSFAFSASEISSTTSSSCEIPCFSSTTV